MELNLSNLHERFSYKDGTNKVTKPNLPKKSPAGKLADLPQVPKSLDCNLKLVFIGYNPGIQTSLLGHRYAHPTNLFWKFIYESGIVSDFKPTCQDDFRLLESHRIGFTDLIHRPTKGITQLSKKEMLDGVIPLIQDIDQYKPKIACFTGKGIYETVLKHAGGSIKGFKWGLQPFDERVFPCLCFVVPSTSGLVTVLSRDERLELWKELNRLLQQL